MILKKTSLVIMHLYVLQLYLLYLLFTVTFQKLDE